MVLVQFFSFLRGPCSQWQINPILMPMRHFRWEKPHRSHYQSHWSTLACVSCLLSNQKFFVVFFFSLFLLQISWISDCILALPCYNSVIEFQKVQIKYKENFFPDLSSLVSTFDTVISESYSEIQLSSLNSVYRLT